MYLSKFSMGLTKINENNIAALKKGGIIRRFFLWLGLKGERV